MLLVNRETLIRIAYAIGGEKAAKIMEVLSQADELTEDEIVSKTGIKLNDVRKLLYKLYERSLVGLRQVRGSNVGWFTFYWRAQLDQVEGFIINQKRRILEKLEERLKHEESKSFYYCYTPGCKRLSFEEATEYLFRCPKCNKSLTYYDNNKIIEAIKRKIEKIKSGLDG